MEITRDQLLLAVVVGLVLSAGLLATAGATLNQSISLDPYFYAAYIHDYADTLERFGRTYYSTRIAFIFPARALVALLGTVGGYFTLRFLMLGAAAAAVFTIGLRFYGTRTAFLAVTWLCFTPWLPRSLLWTLYDGVGVVYLLIGMAFLVVPTRRWRYGHAAAGAFFALAVNCNLLLLAVGGLFIPGWLFINRRRGDRWLDHAVVLALCGFLSMYLVLALALYVEFPEQNFLFESVTFQTAGNLLSGGAQKWFASLSHIYFVDHDFASLIPIAFLAAGLLLPWPKRSAGRSGVGQRDFTLLTLLYLASVTALAWGFHFVLHAGWLSRVHTNVYFVPACVLAVLLFGGTAERHADQKSSKAAIYSGIAVILVSWLAWRLAPLGSAHLDLYVWFAIAVAMSAAAAALRYRSLAAIGVVAGCALMTTSLYQYADYSRIVQLPKSNNEREWDVYRGAVALQKFVNTNVPATQTVGFWYNPADGYLNSLQSVFLWGASRAFGGLFDARDGMPFVTGKFRDLAPRKKILALLGAGDAEVAAGFAALRAAAMPAHEVRRMRYRGQVWGYTVALAQLERPEQPLGRKLFSLSSSDLHAVNGATLSGTAEQPELVTAATRRGYSLIGALGADRRALGGPAVVRVRLRVQQGVIGVSVSARPNVDHLVVEAMAWASPDTQVVDLDVPKLLSTDQLNFRNYSPNGASRAKIDSIEVFWRW